MNVPRTHVAMRILRNASRILALLCSFDATAAVAQSYLVINNTSQTLLCSTRIPNGIWQKWFELTPGTNFTSPPGNPQIQFQCRPPVKQVAYTLQPGQQYNLLQSGAEVNLVSISGQ